MKNIIWNLRKTTSTDLDTRSNIQLFLSFQIKCIRRARETRLILWCSPLRLLVRPLIALERVDKDRFNQSQCLIRLHNNKVQSQLKNRWAWDSSSQLYRTQVDSVERKLSRSFVLNLRRTKSHRINLYHGKDHFSQTTLCQLTTLPLR